MRKILMIVVFFCANMSFSQNDSNDSLVLNIKSYIKEHYIKKNNIENFDNVGIGTYEIIDKSALETNKKGVYLVRLEYKTNSNDCLLFKDKEKFEIIELGDLKTILNKTTEFFKNDSNEILIKYLDSIIFWYKDNQGHLNKNKVKLIKKNK
jgi:hypothetical protein